MATFNDPFGPNANGWALQASEPLQVTVHVALPSVALTSALAATSLTHAVIGGAAMLAIQEVGKRLPVYGDLANDNDLLDERIPITLGAIAAIVVVALGTPTPLTSLAFYAALAAALTMWPRAFHRWRGSLTAATSGNAYPHPREALTRTEHSAAA